MLKYQVRASTSSTSSSRTGTLKTNKNKSQASSTAPDSEEDIQENKNNRLAEPISAPAYSVTSSSIPSSTNREPALKHRTIISIGDEDNQQNVPVSMRVLAPAFHSRSSTTSSASTTNSSVVTGTTIPRARSNSFNSLSSMSSKDSFERESDGLTSDWGYLRVFTFGVKSDTDYKTLKITNRTTSRDVVEMLLSKFRLSFRDYNLFQLWMEVRTRHNGEEVKSILELDKGARPLELQRCHPQEMSRFILSMVSNAILARIYDGSICPQSNYKSVLISRRTTCAEALGLVLQMCRIQREKPDLDMLYNSSAADAYIDYRLFVVENEEVEAEIPTDCIIAGVYLSLMPNQKIVLKRVVLPVGEGLSGY